MQLTDKAFLALKPFKGRAVALKALAEFYWNATVNPPPGAVHIAPLELPEIKISQRSNACKYGGESSTL